jgi:hypothetical protein
MRCCCDRFGVTPCVLRCSSLVRSRLRDGTNTGLALAACECVTARMALSLSLSTSQVPPTRPNVLETSELLAPAPAPDIEMPVSWLWSAVWGRPPYEPKCVPGNVHRSCTSRRQEHRGVDMGLLWGALPRYVLPPGAHEVHLKQGRFPLVRFTSPSSTSDACAPGSSVGHHASLYCPQDRAGTDVQTHRNATKAPLTGNRSTKYVCLSVRGPACCPGRSEPWRAQGLRRHG